MSRVLILEDDINQSLEIELTLVQINNLIVDTALSIYEAQKSINLHRPDIIIADIMLSDEENALKWIAEASLNIPVIVLTGNTGEGFYKQSKGIRASVFLVKPVNTLTLKYEVEKLLDKSKADEAYVLVKDEGKLVRVAVSDVYWVQTEGNYSTIKTEQKKYVFKKSLSKIGLELDSPYLIRVHRSTIVNIQKIVQTDLRTERIEMVDGRHVPLGKTYKSDYAKIMQDYFNTI